MQVDPETKVLNLIRQEMMKNDLRKTKQKIEEEKKMGGAMDPYKGVKLAKEGEISFDKEKTESIMEGLMNRIVAKPNLITDDALNAKIEKIFSVEAF